MGTHDTHAAIFGPEHERAHFVRGKPYMAGGYRNVDVRWYCKGCPATGEYTQRA